MDIPSMRRDISLRHNIQWLIRNLPALNSQHPDFREAFSLLKKLDPAQFGE